MRELYIKAAPPGSMLARAEDRAGITAGPDKFFEAVLAEIALRLKNIESATHVIHVTVSGCPDADRQRALDRNK